MPMLGYTPEEAEAIARAGREEGRRYREYQNALSRIRDATLELPGTAEEFLRRREMVPEHLRDMYDRDARRDVERARAAVERGLREIGFGGD